MKFHCRCFAPRGTCWKHRDSPLIPLFGTTFYIFCKNKRETLKMVFFRNIFQLRGVGSSGSPKLYAKYWWPLFLALKTRPFLAKNDIFIPNSTEEGGSTGLGIIPKKILMLKICKHTLYAYLSRIWKSMQFTRFIRKIFVTKILLSGIFFVFFWLWPEG